MIKKLRFPTWTVPAALLLAGLAAFGLLMPRLGFYWDDWNPILILRVYGVDAFWKFYALDRPSSAWSYVVLTPLLGASPLAWQIFTFALRWLTAVSMWWAFSVLWPRARRAVAAAALLFMVYPVFTQQSIAVTYHQLWLEYALFFVSIAAMLKAARSLSSRLRFGLWTLLGLAAFTVNFSISEYFIGVELLRPVLVWIVLLESEPRWRKRLGRTLLLWLPYLLALALFIYWRLFLVHIPGGDPNKPVFLSQLLSQPLAAIQGMAQIVARDVVQTLVSAWYQTFNPDIFELSRSFNILLLALMLAAALAAIFYLLRLNGQEDEGQEHPDLRSWLLPMAVVGLLAVLMGSGPAWVTGRFMVPDPAAGALPPDPFSDRYAAAGMFGAALLLVAFLEWLTPRRLQKIIVLGALIGLAVGMQVRTANDYRWFWTSQSRFFWQLHWRAPSIAPGTALLAKDDIFPLQGRYATSVALNLAYPQQIQPETLNAWLISVERSYRNSLPELRKGVNFKEKFRIFRFQGSSTDSLVVSYNPDNGSCLWVLRPDESYAPGLSETMQGALPVSNPASVSVQETPGYPPRSIFGPEPARTWCYFYEKAALSRDQQDWKGVVSLLGQARAQGYAPGRSGSDTAFEWLPFIEGLAQAGQWQDALDLTTQVSSTKRISTVDGMLCQFWKGLAARAPESAQRQATITNISQLLKCPK